MQVQLVLTLLMAALSLAASGCNRRLDAGPTPDAAAVVSLRKSLASSSGAGEGAATEAAATAKAEGWGTIRGTFKLTGAAPAPGKIQANKDEQVCGKHPLFDESVVVGSDAGLENVFIYLRTPNVPVNSDYEATAKQPVTLDNRDCRFAPHAMVFRGTQPLVLKNSDPVGHNSKIDGINNPGLNVLLPGNSESPQSLGKEEGLPIKVGCSIHPWMGGWLLVRKDPYGAVSDNKGSFAIEKLPAGVPLEFQLWQEKAGFLKGVSAAGIQVDAKGRFKVTLKPDQELALDVSVPADVLSK